MSWNIAKRLKEVTLSFSKSQSPTRSERRETTTLATLEERAETPEPLYNSDARSIVSDNGSMYVDAPTHIPATKTSKPGILALSIHEGQGFTLPGHYRDLPKPNGRSGNLREATIDPVRTSTSSRHSISTRAGSLDVPTPSSGSARTSFSQYRTGGSMPYALVEFDKSQFFINSVDGSPENPFWAGSNTQYKFDVSRVSPLTITIYLRNPNASPTSGRSQDIFMGVTQITPNFDEPYSEVLFLPLHHGTGKLQIGLEYVETQERKLAIDDFHLLKVIGKGSFGKVMQVRKKDTQRIYALKTIRKAKIISRSEVAHTLAERSILAQINNPFIVPLKFSFQSPEKLYFVLAFVNGGELFYHLTREKRFDINRSRLYTAELLCVLECLHGFNVIYRDLKPENILLDYEGHIALCDFGLCKSEMKDEDETNTFCGTPEYLAPELLRGKGYNKTVDWWTLGVLLYEMLTGLPPFYDENTNEMYRKILTEPLHFPSSDIVPPIARDILTKLLTRDPAKRLGKDGAGEIKSHPFFQDISWRRLLQRGYEPMFKPSVTSASDTICFDEIFITQTPIDSVVEGSAISQTLQHQFDGFTYHRPIEGLHDAGGSIQDTAFASGR